MEKIEMNRVIMIKYGELTTKKSNRKLFVNALYNNLKNNNAKIIMNISYRCDESLTFTDYYSVQAVENNKVTSDCNKLIKGINKYNINLLRLFS